MVLWPQRLQHWSVFEPSHLRWLGQQVSAESYQRQTAQRSCPVWLPLPCLCRSWPARPALLFPQPLDQSQFDPCGLWSRCWSPASAAEMLPSLRVPRSVGKKWKGGISVSFMPCTGVLEAHIIDQECKMATVAWATCGFRLYNSESALCWLRSEKLLRCICWTQFHTTTEEIWSHPLATTTTTTTTTAAATTVTITTTSSNNITTTFINSIIFQGLVTCLECIPRSLFTTGYIDIGYKDTDFLYQTMPVLHASIEWEPLVQGVRAV